MVMMMMVVVVMMVVLAALRPLLAISRGRGATNDDPANKQIDTDTHHISSFISFPFLFSMYLCLWILFKTLDCILRTPFTFLLLFGDMYLIYNSWQYMYATLFSSVHDALKSKLDYALSSHLGRGNHERSLDGGITIQIEKGIRLYLPPCMRVHGLAYASVDLACACRGPKNPSHLF